MTRKTILTLLGLFLIVSVAQAVLAQGDVPRIEYNETYTHSFTEANEQLFLQFEGGEGDLVYLLADYTEFVIADLGLDLRDSVGRSVGFKEEFEFNEFVLAELPGTGLFTVVVTAEEPSEVDILLGLTGYLEDGITTSLEDGGFNVLFGVRAEETGYYDLAFSRTDGELATSFSVVTYSEFFTERIIQVNGNQVAAWNARISLQAGDQYVAFLDENLFRERGSEATVEITLERVD